jgi:uroporphyrinogen decarboxylase
MNEKERFLRTLRFQEPDRAPLWEAVGIWPESLEKWFDEGYPKDAYLSKYWGFEWDGRITNYWNLHSFFGFDRRDLVSVDSGLLPRFLTRTVKETAAYRLSTNEYGVTLKEKLDGTSIPQFIEFPVKNREDFRKIKPLYDPDDPARYPKHSGLNCRADKSWKELVEEYNSADYPVGLLVIGFFAQPREWMGLENFLLSFYDDPAFVGEMMEFWGDFCLAMAGRVLSEVNVDFLKIWEDMAFKTASLLSPKFIREYMMPQYKRIVDFVRSKGVDIIFVDSDGNCDELIPLYLESGINGIYPLEVKAGNDPVAVRKKYGTDLFFFGGIEKEILAGSTRGIEEEVLKKVPSLLESGGYIPSIDHAVPSNSTLKNYMFYIDLLKKLYNIR